MVTPMRVCRKRSSVAWTPVLRSPRSLSKFALGSPSCIAFVTLLPRSSISLASIAMTKVGSAAREVGHVRTSIQFIAGCGGIRDSENLGHSWCRCRCRWRLCVRLVRAFDCSQEAVYSKALGNASLGLWELTAERRQSRNRQVRPPASRYLFVAQPTSLLLGLRPQRINKWPRTRHQAARRTLLEMARAACHTTSDCDAIYARRWRGSGR